MRWHDLSRLFGPLSAGTFEEAVYFLPLAFRHMQERRDGYIEFITGLVYWVSHHHGDLAALKADRVVSAELRATLDAWTAHFHVDHYDRDACRSKGWVLEYDDIVEDSQWVAETAHALVSEEAYASVALEFVADLAEAASPTRAAWFLEFARWQEEGLFNRITGETRSAHEEADHAEVMRQVSSEDGVTMSEEDIKGALEAGRRSDGVRSSVILHMVRDQTVRRRAADIVVASNLHDPDATYWRDAFRCLEIEP